MQTSELGGNPVTSEADMQAADAAGGDWREALPDQLQGLPYFKNAETLDQVVADIEGAAFWQGNSILKPSAEASDDAKAANREKLRELYPDLVEVPQPGSEEYGAFFNQLGKPESAEGYAVPEGIELPDIDALKQIAFASNMTAKQFADQISAMAAARGDADSNFSAARKADMDGLAKEWGATYDGNITNIDRFLEMTGAPESFIAAHKDGRMSAADYRWLNKIVMAGDEGTEAATIEVQSTGMTPAQGVQMANDIREKMHTIKNTDPRWRGYMNQLLEAEGYAAGG
jgi:hypothetical protein